MNSWNNSIEICQHIYVHSFTSRSLEIGKNNLWWHSSMKFFNIYHTNMSHQIFLVCRYLTAIEMRIEPIQYRHLWTTYEFLIFFDISITISDFMSVLMSFRACITYSLVFSWCLKSKIGRKHQGVQGVPSHTQYLVLHLAKTMYVPEKVWVRYLCAHPMHCGDFP